MLIFKCDRCGRELKQAGALVFSPPNREAWMVEKHHVCAECWPELVAFLKDKNSQSSEKSQGR
jgi:hypothetical protein